MRFGNDMGCTEFEYSNGWLTRFKTRHSISCHSISGESAHVDKRLISDGRKQALNVMKKFSRNIFSVDENSLFYRMDPDKSLTTSSNNKGKRGKRTESQSFCAPTLMAPRKWMCSGRVNSSCSISATRRVNLVTNPVISHEWGKDLEVFTTSGTYPWSFLIHMMYGSLELWVSTNNVWVS